MPNPAPAQCNPSLPQPSTTLRRAAPCNPTHQIFMTNGIAEKAERNTTGRPSGLHISVSPVGMPRLRIMCFLPPAVQCAWIGWNRKWKNRPNGPHWPVWPFRPIVPFPVQQPPFPHYNGMGNDLFVDAAESASFPLPGTGKREGGKKFNLSITSNQGI